MAPGRNGASDGPAESTVGSQLAEELRALRTKSGKSLKDLESDLHVSDSSLSRYLSGTSRPPWNVVEGLCRVAGTRPQRLRGLWEQADQHDQPEPQDTDRGQRRSRTPARRLSVRRAWREKPARVLTMAVVATAVVVGGLGVLAGGIWLAPARQLATQDAACLDWPWPPAEGQIAESPATPKGADHTPTVQLLTGVLDGHTMAWARIVQARYGDRVWLDWTDNGGKTSVQCGPFVVTTDTGVSRAHEMNPQWMFRACGDTPRAAVNSPRNACTAFW